MLYRKKGLWLTVLSVGISLSPTDPAKSCSDFNFSGEGSMSEVINANGTVTREWEFRSIRCTETSSPSTFSAFSGMLRVLGAASAKNSSQPTQPSVPSHMQPLRKLAANIESFESEEMIRHVPSLETIHTTGTEGHPGLNCTDMLMGMSTSPSSPTSIFTGATTAVGDAARSFMRSLTPSGSPSKHRDFTPKNRAQSQVFGQESVNISSTRSEALGASSSSGPTRQAQIIGNSGSSPKASRDPADVIHIDTSTLGKTRQANEAAAAAAEYYALSESVSRENNSRPMENLEANLITPTAEKSSMPNFQGRSASSETMPTEGESKLPEALGSVTTTAPLASPILPEAQPSPSTDEVPETKEPELVTDKTPTLTLMPEVEQEVSLPVAEEVKQEPMQEVQEVQEEVQEVVQKVVQEVTLPISQPKTPQRRPEPAPLPKATVLPKAFPVQPQPSQAQPAQPVVKAQPKPAPAKAQPVAKARPSRSDSEDSLVTNATTSMQIPVKAPSPAPAPAAPVAPAKAQPKPAPAQPVAAKAQPSRSDSEDSLETTGTTSRPAPARRSTTQDSFVTDAPSTFSREQS